MEQNVCNFNQMGYCKFGKECHRFHEDQVFTIRHPKECKYYTENSFCKFGRDCTFRFSHNDNVKKIEFGSAVEDIKNLKAEVDNLKNTVKSHIYIKHEGKVMKKIIGYLKSEIKQIQKENFKISQRIKNLEAEFEEEADEESENEKNESSHLDGLFSCTYCHSEFGIRKHFDDHVKVHEQNKSGVYELKCRNCDYVCQIQLLSIQNS